MKSLDPWDPIIVDPYGDVVWPVARWGHPFYSEVPSWIHYGNGGGTTRLLFDGAFIGAEVPTMQQFAPQRRGLVAEVAPIIAPATGGITVKKELDDRQVLHVEICVDGKCHRASMDLAPAIAMLMDKLSRWHTGQHASPTVVVGCAEHAVGIAEDAIVGALVARHVNTIAGSWLGDIGNAVKGVAHGVVGTLKKLKGPIKVAASAAAMAGATAIPGVGPVAAPLAGKLSGDLVESALGDSKAKKAVAQATEKAQTDPVVAVALDQAQKAVANSTAAHHVQDTAKKAAKGEPDAQQQIKKVAEDAEQGDPGAKAVADVVSNAMQSEWGAKLWEKLTGRGPDVVSGQWYDVVGQGRPQTLQFPSRQNSPQAALERLRDRIVNFNVAVLTATDLGKALSPVADAWDSAMRPFKNEWLTFLDTPPEQWNWNNFTYWASRWNVLRTHLVDLLSHVLRREQLRDLEMRAP